MVLYNHKYVTEDISTHAKFIKKWYKKSEESRVCDLKVTI